MNNEYSTALKKLMKIKPGFIMRIIWIGVMSILLAVIIYSFILEKRNAQRQRENVQVFDSTNKISSYSSITPTILSDQFAVSEDNSVCFCIVYDKKYQPYIIAVKSKILKEQYRNLINYTYDDMVKFPGRIIPLRGIPVKMSEHLINMAVEAYKDFCHSDAVDKDMFRAVFGKYYLDTTQKPKENYTVMVLCIFIFAVMGMYYYFAIISSGNSSQRCRATLDKFDEKELYVIDQELNYPTTVEFKKQKLYFLKNYIISGFCGLDIIPVREIVEVYGLNYCKRGKSIKKSIVAVTNDGVKHEITVVSMRFNGDILYNQIVERMNMRLPNVKYGIEDGSFIFTVDYYHMTSGVKTFYSEEKTRVRGVAGAFLGGSLGGMFWIFWGRMDLMAGIAGIFIAFFAVLGYYRLAGFLDRKGVLISFFISFFMISAANYMLYEMTLYKYYYSSTYDIANMVKSLKQLPAISTTDYWNNFIKDLMIGYILMICTFTGINSSMVKQK